MAVRWLVAAVVVLVIMTVIVVESVGNLQKHISVSIAMPMLLLLLLQSLVGIGSAYFPLLMRSLSAEPELNPLSFVYFYIYEGKLVV